MQLKTKYNIGWFVAGITSLYMFSNACGSVAPDIETNSCLDQEVSNTATASIASTSDISSSSVTAAGSGGNSASVTSGSTGGGMQQPIQYDTPALDEIMSRLHSCHKLTYTQLGTLLHNRGVAIPPGNVTDLKSTQVQIFGMTQTLSNIFGGSGSSCEMAITTANGTNDPVCASNETCFCNQDDKAGQINKSCLDVGNNSPDAADGFCVAKPATAGYLYFTGKDALGYPKLDSRLGEKEEHSTASAMKLMDIFIQAAPQIIANISDPSKAPACTLNGKNSPMFASDGSCIEESVSCLIGYPATDDHMLLCNLLLQKAIPGDTSDLIKKRNIAVAVLLSAAHSCQ
jgi:hypothetical protein